MQALEWWAEGEEELDNPGKGEDKRETIAMTSCGCGEEKKNKQQNNETTFEVYNTVNTNETFHYIKNNNSSCVYRNGSANFSRVHIFAWSVTFPLMLLF